MPNRLPHDTKRSRLPAAERKKLILDSARTVFMQRGFSGARTKDIAERAGVTEAFLYSHFDSKEEMYAATILDPVTQGYSSFASDVEELVKRRLDSGTFVYELNRRALEFFREYASMINGALYAELANGRQYYSTTLSPIFSRLDAAIYEGVGRDDPGIDGATLRRSLLGQSWAIGLDHTTRSSELDVDAVAERMTRFYTLGVRERRVV